MHFYETLAKHTYVVSAYFHSGASRTLYKGENEEEALNTFIARSDSFDKKNNNIHDVELYVHGHREMNEIVHPMEK